MSWGTGRCERHHGMLRSKRLDVIVQQGLDGTREQLRDGRGDVGGHERAQVVDDDAQIVWSFGGHLAHAHAQLQRATATATDASACMTDGRK